MPRLACFTCGRQIYTVAPLNSLFTEERRCPRCGAQMQLERRERERRETIRRSNPVNESRPPDAERRTTDRRVSRRRRDLDAEAGRRPPRTRDEGWTD